MNGRDYIDISNNDPTPQNRIQFHSQGGIVRGARTIIKRQGLQLVGKNSATVNRWPRGAAPSLKFPKINDF